MREREGEGGHTRGQGRHHRGAPEGRGYREERVRPRSAPAPGYARGDLRGGRDDDATRYGGYAERGPGRGDYPGRGDRYRVGRESPYERELSRRSHWRDADRDERSRRWTGVPGRDDGRPGAAAARGSGFRGRGPKNYTRADARIAEDLNERLTDDPELDAGDITVDVRDGVVVLGGRVDRRWMKHRAEDIADACGGVRDIENRIRVGPVQSGDDGADEARDPPRNA